MLEAAGSQGVLTDSAGKPIRGPQDSVRDWIAVLPKLRDSVIVLGTTAYLFGYVIWALYAWKYGLGTRPALQFQYIVAGTPILLILGLWVAAFYWAPTLFHKLHLLVARRLSKNGLSVLTHGLLVAGVVSALAGGRLREFSSLTSLLSALLFLAAISIAGVRPPVRLFVASSAPLLVLVVYSYAADYYAQVPQEFGGGQPRCVVVSRSESTVTESWRDLVRDSNLSELTTRQRRGTRNQAERELIALLEKRTAMLFDPNTPPAKFQETAPLLLWLESDDTLLVSTSAFSSDMENRYVLPRTDSTSIEYIGELGFRASGCPDLP